MVTKAAVDELHAQAQAHALKLLDLLARSESVDDPLVACSLALDCVRFATELRFMSELVLGRLLLKYPDPGGRPRQSAPATTARELREMICANRTTVAWLTRLAENVDPSAAESIASEIWSLKFPRQLSARTIVIGIRGE